MDETTKEIQQNELEALRAIFMDDYKDVETKTAWNVKQDTPEFVIQVRPTDENIKNNVSVGLHIKLPKTYPRTAPQISLENGIGLSDVQMQSALAAVKWQVNKLLGGEMIYELAIVLSEYITDNNSAAQADKPSFYQQMVDREKAGRQADIEREAAHRRRQQEAYVEEQEDLQRRILEELERKRQQVLFDQQKQQHLSDIADAVHSVAGRWAEGIQLLKFNNTVYLDPLMTRNGRFTTVALEESTVADNLCSVYDAYPTDLVGASIHLSDRFTVQCFVVTNLHYLTDQGRKSLERISARIVDLAQIRHQNMVTTYGCHMEVLEERNQNPGIRLWVLSDTLSTHEGSTLEDVLESCGSIATAQTRTYLRHILLSLVSLHAAGFIHRSVMPSNILLTKEGKSRFVAKLFNTSYREEIIELHRITPLSESIGDTVGNDIRFAPEVIDRPDMMGRKNDIWCAGVTGLQMALGLDALRSVAIGDEPKVLELNSESMAPSLFRVLSLMLTADHRQRPTAMEILNDAFFNQGLDGEPPVHRQALDSASRGLTFEMQRSARMAEAGMAAQTAENNLASDAGNARPFFSVAQKNIASDADEHYQKKVDHGIKTKRRPPPLANVAAATSRLPSQPSPQPSRGAVQQKISSNRRRDTIRNASSDVDTVMRPLASRYRTDFEEIEFLGKGGFGSVVKARNRIDGRFYAIKKIKLDARDTEGNKKIFREVTTLSRLHHQNIVRYYTTWVEDFDVSSGMTDIPEEESELSEQSVEEISLNIELSHSSWSTEQSTEGQSKEESVIDGGQNSYIVDSGSIVKVSDDGCGNGDDDDEDDLQICFASPSDFSDNHSNSGCKFDSRSAANDSSMPSNDANSDSGALDVLNPRVDNDMLAPTKNQRTSNVFSAIRFGTMRGSVSDTDGKRERSRAVMPKSYKPVREFTAEYMDLLASTDAAESTDSEPHSPPSSATSLRMPSRGGVFNDSSVMVLSTDDSDGDDDKKRRSSSLRDLLLHEQQLQQRHMFHEGGQAKHGDRWIKGKQPVAQQKKNKILYIQMEYCENKTLNDLIKEGLDEKECWKVFGQILEGLHHIHERGVIHRDLKPVNAFLDGAGDIKIGDFGLATSSFAPIDPAASRHLSLDRSAEDAMTADIGTSTYVAPEVTTKGSGATRYNQKVDMYSLGIIFFEMCYPLKTGMERATVLHNLRKPEIVFPDDFPADKMQLQYQIIRRLLSHSPRMRPSSAELLESDLLPPKMEDEYIRETIKTIANPSQPYFTKLMDSLFAHSTDKHIDATFDYRSNDIYTEQLNAVFLDRIRETMTRVFRTHAAVELSTPALTPKMELLDMYQKPALYLDSKGNVVQLPYDQTVPFARYVARTRMTEIKRYCFDRYFVANAAGGQPVSYIAASFDAVTNRSAHAVAAAEVVSVVCEVFDELPAFRSMPIVLMINHMCILDAILAYCGILQPEWTAAATTATADRKQSTGLDSHGDAAGDKEDGSESTSKYDGYEARPEDAKRRAQFVRNVCFCLSGLYREKAHIIRQRIQVMSLTTGAKLHPHSLDRLQPFMDIHGDLSTVQREVLARIGSECGMSGTAYALRGAEYVHNAIRAFNELRYVEATVRHFGVAIPIVYSPLFNHHYSYYEGGYSFQIMTDTSYSKTKPPQVLAMGGRYDGLLKRFRHLAGSYLPLEGAKTGNSTAGPADRKGRGKTADIGNKRAKGGSSNMLGDSDIDTLTEDLSSTMFAKRIGSLHSSDVWQQMYSKYLLGDSIGKSSKSSSGGGDYQIDEGMGAHSPLMSPPMSPSGTVNIGTNLSSGSAALGTARDVVCVGVQIHLDLVIQEMARYQQKVLQASETSATPTFGLWTRKRCDVVVASFGTRPMLKERIALARELWTNGLRTDFLFNDDPEMTMERLVEICTDQGMNWIVTLKRKPASAFVPPAAAAAGSAKASKKRSDKSKADGMGGSNDGFLAGGFGALQSEKYVYKVKNILRRVECEVPRENLLEWLHTDISEQYKLDLHTHESKGWSSSGFDGSGSKSVFARRLNQHSGVRSGALVNTVLSSVAKPREGSSGLLPLFAASGSGGVGGVGGGSSSSGFMMGESSGGVGIGASSAHDSSSGGAAIGHGGGGAGGSGHHGGSGIGGGGAGGGGRLELTIVNPQLSAKNLSRTKHKQKMMLTDRAMSSVNRIINEVKGAPALVFDLGAELLRRLGGEPSILTDAGYKRIMELCSAHQRAYIVELRIFMERYKREGCSYVWLYSVKGDYAITYKL
ncbi:eukaryotic translation initiation factor 2-alpha kinase [Coemansia spiralis]|uniref:non-specific serine/threonine protein kinase n=2 Tax=Coemansia TaxID=4863 RepID=A0A9W8G0J9_9FUNG|nr:eukaryotic translation initiation factor 2-alpha kinase [Coemansia umbellata]KAJ2621440.1 eukaryotic translation initiation factor 2-alpha kinase [Coemansia sp. RSA 1358]KAJ2674415.1 eukaryotic translation initiation factor 2-alpha kinase [Coemansia spiralis]